MFAGDRFMKKNEIINLVQAGDRRLTYCEPSKEYIEFTDKAETFGKKIKSQIKDKKLLQEFDRLLQIWDEIYLEEITDSFNNGFRYGMLLSIDVIRE